MRCSVGISNFLEGISSLSHSIVFLYFFALITEEGFLFFFLERKAFLSLLAIGRVFKWVYPSFSPLPLAFLLFSAICKASSDNHFAFLHFFFLGVVLTTASCTMSWIFVQMKRQKVWHWITPQVSRCPIFYFRRVEKQGSLGPGTNSYLKSSEQVEEDTPKWYKLWSTHNGFWARTKPLLSILFFFSHLQFLFFFFLIGERRGENSF